MKKLVSCSLLLGMGLFFGQPLLSAKAAGKGNLTGFIYDKDGTTPVQGAVVKLKNLATGSIFESAESDEQGAFKIADVDQGLYIFGVTSSQGDFNASDVLGIAENETAKLAVALKPFEAAGENETAKLGVAPAPFEAVGGVDAKAEAVPYIKGENWVGKVMNYDVTAKEALIYITEGELKKDESFHVKGDKKKYNSDTDYWQKAKIIKQNGFEVKKAVAGQFCNIPMEKSQRDNDFVYVKESRGPGWFFLTPLGLATILAGTTAIALVVVPKKPTASQFRY